MESSVVITETEWIKKYNHALEEENPAVQMARVEDARNAMAARIGELDEASPERHVIQRALGVLAGISEELVASNS